MTEIIEEQPRVAFLLAHKYQAATASLERQPLPPRQLQLLLLLHGQRVGFRISNKDMNTVGDKDLVRVSRSDAL